MLTARRSNPLSQRTAGKGRIVYALVIDGVIEAVRNPSRHGETKLLDGKLLRPPESGWTESMAATCGFLLVVDPGAPALTPLQALDPSTVEPVAGVPTLTYHPRDKTAQELADEQLVATRSANNETLTDLESVRARIADIKAFLVDPDVQAVLDQPNTTALTVQQTNRALKALVRQARRDANLTLRVARYAIGQARPELLDDVSDI
jgi:hypothetical protein